MAHAAYGCYSLWKPLRYVCFSIQMFDVRIISSPWPLCAHFHCTVATWLAEWIMACLRKYANAANGVIGECIISPVNPVSISKLCLFEENNFCVLRHQLALALLLSVLYTAEQQVKSGDILSRSLDNLLAFSFLLSFPLAWNLFDFLNFPEGISPKGSIKF